MYLKLTNVFKLCNINDSKLPGKFLFLRHSFTSIYIYTYSNIYICIFTQIDEIHSRCTDIKLIEVHDIVLM